VLTRSDNETNPKVYTLSPSDFAFLWQECRRCFYRKVVQRTYRPRSPMPRVFNTIDSKMKDRLGDAPLHEFVCGAPEARVHSFDGRVLSEVYRSRSGGPGIRIKGIYDTVLSLRTGAFGIVDLKTSDVCPKLAETYGRQLHGYAFALEHPESKLNRLAPIERLGLIAFEPTRFASRSDGTAALVGRNVWVEIARHDNAFFTYLDEVAMLLDSEVLPAPGENCSYCRFLLNSKQENWDPSKEPNQLSLVRADNPQLLIPV